MNECKITCDQTPVWNAERLSYHLQRCRVSEGAKGQASLIEVLLDAGCT